MNKTLAADPGIAMHVAAFAGRTRAIQLDLLESVFSDPAQAMPIAVAAGIDQIHFADDLEILWLSAELAHRLSTRHIYDLARRALQSHFLWDDSQINANYGTSFLWSDATLAQLFGAMFFSAQYIECTAAGLIEQARRWREITTHFDYSMKLLEAA